MPKRIIVVGGGITGLAAAHRVVELSRERNSPVEVLLVEAAPRLGGNILTVRRDGFLIEGGPDAFITQKPAGMALCRRIGIADQIIGTNPACRRTYIVRDGAMHPVPEGFLLLAPSRIWPFVTSRLFSWPAKMRMALDYILPRKDHGETGDESLADFVRRRFGREALERIAQPMVGGIYTADPEELGLRATMPRFLEMENRYGSIIRAMRADLRAAQKRAKESKNAAGGASPSSSSAAKSDSGARYSLFVSFREGMQVLIDALTSRIPAQAVRLSSAVARVAPAVSGPRNNWQVNLQSGEVLDADAVILASPAHATGRMLADLDAELSRDLSAIRYASSATMTLAFRRNQMRDLLDGFGFVVPALERRTLLAVTVSSTKFENRAPEGCVLLRAFLGGAMHPHVYAMPDDQLRSAVLRDIRDLMGVQGEPLMSELYRWPASMPQYPVGHLDHVARLRSHVAKHPGLFVAGNAFGGVGIPDCVASAESAAQSALDCLAGA